MKMRDKTLLKQMQSLPLDAKILLTERRIVEWYNYFHGNVCISFSGGKDSTVLAHLVHGIYPEVPMVFANTGLEYPEIQMFARKMGCEFVRPKMSFSEVISKYGYPIISKEVAEAISYARRIVPKNAETVETLERERERERTACWKRTELHGNRPNLKHSKDEPAGEEQTSQATRHYPPPLQEKCEKSKCSEDNSWGKTNWKMWRRNCLIGVDNFSGSSQFNKLKWLPLCQDTQFMISHYCCNVMKKSPISIYQRKTGLKPYIGTMAEESRMRTQAWIRHGCNAFDCHKQTSQPMSMWTEQDVLHYILLKNLEICSVYGEILAIDDAGMMYDPLPGVDCKLKCTGCQRTGCVFCGFGAHLEKGETRFQRLAKTHPKQYEYCMNGGQWVDNPKHDPSAPRMEGDWKNWNPKKIWVPSKEGLGMRKVFDDCNAIYGKGFIRYE